MYDTGRPQSAHLNISTWAFIAARIICRWWAVPRENVRRSEGEMRERSLYEALEDICTDLRADTKAPGELAAMLKPWLTNLDERSSYPDNAPLMLRQIADAPGWNRFGYSDPLMRWISGAH